MKNCLPPELIASEHYITKILGLKARHCVLCCNCALLGKAVLLRHIGNNTDCFQLHKKGVYVCGRAGGEG